MSMPFLLESILIYENVRIWGFFSIFFNTKKSVLLRNRAVSYEFYSTELEKLDLLQLYEYASINTEAYSYHWQTVSDIHFSLVFCFNILRLIRLICTLFQNLLSQSCPLFQTDLSVSFALGTAMLTV